MTDIGWSVKNPPDGCKCASNAIVIRIGELERIRATRFERKRRTWANPIGSRIW
jgi:hypothetical protein